MKPKFIDGNLRGEHISEIGELGDQDTKINRSDLRHCEVLC